MCNMNSLVTESARLLTKLAADSYDKDRVDKEYTAARYTANKHRHEKGLDRLPARDEDAKHRDYLGAKFDADERLREQGKFDSSGEFSQDDLEVADLAAKIHAKKQEDPGILDRIRATLGDAYSAAEPYIPSAALGAGGIGLASQLMSDKDKGIMDYLPWLLLGGAGGYGVYNQLKGQ